MLRAVPVLSVLPYVVMLPTEPSPSRYIISPSTNSPPSLSCGSASGRVAPVACGGVVSAFSFWGIASLGPLYRHPVPGTTITTMGGVVSSLERELSDVERPSMLPASLGMPVPPSCSVASGGGPPPLLLSSLPVLSRSSLLVSSPFVASTIVVAVWAWVPPLGLVCFL